MLNSGKKIRDKKKYSNSRVVRIKNSERNKKPYPPSPPQVKWSVPYLSSKRGQVKNFI
jgi:hypothetical protein